jgi:hypothetical protein
MAAVVGMGAAWKEMPDKWAPRGSCFPNKETPKSVSRTRKIDRNGIKMWEDF